MSATVTPLRRQAERPAPSPAGGLDRWAERRARSLAELYLRDHAETESPAAFLERMLARELLLSRHRSAAEPAFLARIAEVEADHG